MAIFDRLNLPSKNAYQTLPNFDTQSNTVCIHTNIIYYIGGPRRTAQTIEYKNLGEKGNAEEMEDGRVNPLCLLLSIIETPPGLFSLCSTMFVFVV